MLTSIRARTSVVSAVAPAGNRTTSVNGSSVDTNGYGHVTFVLHPAAITDGTFTPKLQDSPDASTWTDVDATYQDGTFAVLASNTLQRVAYIGAQRYVRLVVTASGSPSTGGIYSACAVLQEPRSY